MSAFRTIQNTLFSNDPGKCYNTGNWISLGGSVAQVAVNVWVSGHDVTTGHIASELFGFFFGEMPSKLTTAASAIYLWAGAQYSKGFSRNDPASINRGHLGSAIGASLLGTGLALLGKRGVPFWSAIVGGALHAGGKTGSLLAARYDDFWKMLPLASRVATIAASVRDIWLNLQTYRNVGTATEHSILPLTLIICSSLYWGKADSILMPNNPVLRFIARTGFISQAFPG